MNDLRTAAQQALEALNLVSDEGESKFPGTIQSAISDLEAALAQEQAEPGKEPAAWRVTDGEGDWEYRTDLPEDWSIQWSARHGRKYEPLYTAPPRRKPLTEEEAAKACSSARYGSLMQIVRAVERAHGIGGQDER